MKAPPNQAIQDAIDSILVSVRHENGWADVSQSLSTALDLQTAIDALHVGLQTFIKVAKAQLADLKTRLNATVVRIDSLPTELIEGILLFSFSKDIAQWHDWRETLLAISRKWHNVVKGCPLFWNQIHDGKYSVLRDIQRSGNTPLHLYFLELPRYTQAIKRDWRPFASCKDRWLTFKFYRDSAQEEVLNSIANANPRLQSLSFVITGEMHPKIRLPAGTQFLRNLTLGGVNLDRQDLSPPSPFLQLLELSQLLLPSLQEIFCLLESTPLLQGLLLQYCDGPEEDLASEYSAISLPHLTTLVLRSVPNVYSLFACINVPPSCESLILDPVPVPTKGTPLFDIATSIMQKQKWAYILDVTSHGLHHEQVVVNTIDFCHPCFDALPYPKSFLDNHKGLKLTTPEMETEEEVIALWDGPLFDFLKSLDTDVQLKIGVRIPPDENGSIASWDLPFSLRYLDTLPITDMVVGGGVDGRAILRHLTTEHSSCPKLTSLNMSINDQHYGSSLREEFQEAITERWAHPADPEDFDSLFELTLGDGETNVYWLY